MRDPERIDRMIVKLHAAWTSLPDMRLMQLLVVLAESQRRLDARQLFNVEDDVFERLLDRYLETGSLF